MRQIGDNWMAGDVYETYMGRWSRQLALSFVKWLSPKMRADWLEVGCGTGALTSAICELALPRLVVACDPSEPFINYARKKLQGERVSFIVATAEDSLSQTRNVNYIVLGLVLNFLPEPEKLMAKMLTAIHRGGMIGAYVWDYSEGVEFLRCFWDIAVDIDPAAAELDEAKRFPICHPEKLRNLFLSSGLQDVTVVSINITTHFQNFEDFWMPFMEGTGPAPSYVASVPPEQRELLRERLSKRLNTESDESIDLNAKAWAIRGFSPI